MSEPTPLDPIDLAMRARIHAGADPGAEAPASLDALAAALDDLLLQAVSMEKPWLLPEGAQIRLMRTAALRVLRVFTERQDELDSAMLSAVALLVEYCRSLEIRVEELTARIDAADSRRAEDGGGA